MVKVIYDNVEPQQTILICDTTKKLNKEL